MSTSFPRATRDKLVLVGILFVGIYFQLLQVVRYYFDAKEVLLAKSPLWHGLSVALSLLVLGAALLFVLQRFVVRVRVNLSIAWMGCLLLAVTVIPRIIMIQYIKVPLTSDFKMYYEMATLYADTSFYNATDYIVVVAPNLLLFIVTLGEMFKSFGTSVEIALYVNLFFLAITVITLFALALRFMRPHLALYACLLYTISPSNLLFSLGVNTEPMGIALSMLALYLWLVALDMESAKRRLGIALCAGALTSLANAIRPNAIIAIIAALLYVFLYPMFAGRQRRIASMSVVIAALMAFFVVNAGIDVLKDEVFQKKTGINYGWTLYEGLDDVNFGGWSAENAQVLMDTIETYPTDQAQEVLLRLAMERTQAWSLADWLKVVGRKGVNIWIHNDYAWHIVFQAPESTTPWNVVPYQLPALTIVNYTYWALLAVFSLSCVQYAIRCWRRPLDGKILILYLPILGMIILHSFATSIPRYHYQIIPNFLLVIFHIQDALLPADKPLSDNAQMHGATK